MVKTMRVLLITTFAALLITSCSSPSVEATPSSSNTLPPPTSTPTQPQPTVYPTITRTNNYCSSYPTAILLPFSNAEGWSEEEIAGKLMELFFAYYHSPQAPDSCRIEGYSVDEINCDGPDLPPVLYADFVCKVQYSYKSVEEPSAAVPGYLDEQNWFHTFNYLAVFRSDSGYTMKFTGFG